MYCNTTMVDMFSVPLSITLSGNANQRVGEVVSGGRARVSERMASTPGFGGLVVDERRVIAPSHGIGAGRFDGGYLDEYVAQSWDAYRDRDLTVVVGPQTYRPRVQGDQIVAWQGDAQRAVFSRPSTSDVLFCNGAVSAPNDGVGSPVAAILGVALNRTTMRDQATQPTTDPAGSYQGERTNHYAKVLHEVHVDDRAYGFAFDDVAGFASYIEDRGARSVELAVDPF